MRKIYFAPVATFFSIIYGCLGLSLVVFFLLDSKFQIWQTSEVLTIAGFFCTSFALIIGAYRLYFTINDVPTGEIQPGTRNERVAMIYQLFIMLIIRPFLQNMLIPVPMTRLIYKALGSSVGHATYFPGRIGDPLHFSIGDGCIVGDDSLIISHAIEGDRLAFYPVKIGNHVTIGTKAIIMAGVTISDGALVAAGAVVPKNTHIGANEVWAGTPARRVGSTKPMAA